MGACVVHRYLPTSQCEKIFLKTADNPSSRWREEVSRSDGGGQKNACLSRLTRFVLWTNALTPTPFSLRELFQSRKRARGFSLFFICFFNY